MLYKRVCALTITTTLIRTTSYPFPFNAPFHVRPRGVWAMYKRRLRFDVALRVASLLTKRKTSNNDKRLRLHCPPPPFSLLSLPPPPGTHISCQLRSLSLSLSLIEGSLSMPWRRSRRAGFGGGRGFGNKEQNGGARSTLHLIKRLFVCCKLIIEVCRFPVKVNAPKTQIRKVAQQKAPTASSGSGSENGSPNKRCLSCLATPPFHPLLCRPFGHLPHIKPKGAAFNELK